MSRMKNFEKDFADTIFGARYMTMSRGINKKFFLKSVVKKIFYETDKQQIARNHQLFEYPKIDLLRFVLKRPSCSSLESATKLSF